MTTIPSPFTATRNTPNKSARQDVPRKGIVLHHAAMTSISGLRDMEVNGTKQVSSTVIIKDNVRERIVPDPYRPWSLADAYWDSALRSVECCNESTNGWTISDASHESLALVTAYFATREGWRPHRDGDPKTWTVLGHRELYTIHGASYATACPGGMDLARVTRRANEIIAAAVAEEEDDMPWTDKWTSPVSGNLKTAKAFLIDAFTEAHTAREKVSSLQADVDAINAKLDALIAAQK